MDDTQPIRVGSAQEGLGDPRLYWLQPGSHRWSFRHAEEFLPSHRVACDPAGTRILPRGAADLAGIAVTGSSRGDASLAEVLEWTDTDAWLVMHDGVLVDERYFHAMTPGTPHMVMSVTKSVVGMITGILVDQGRLVVEEPVTRYIPELESSGYRGARVRDLLDMRSGVHFREDYADPTSHVRLLEAAIGWRPGTKGVHPGIHEFLRALDRRRPHGGAFEYRSSETDVLGWVCERAAGTSMSALISDLIWRPMGAEHDAALLCDAFGAAVHDGGLAAKPRDMARFGQLLLDAGVVGDRDVVPRDWIADIWAINADVRGAFASSPAEASFPGGWYHNQCWVVPGPHGDLILCLGIYGQLIRIDPATRTVIVKLSSWDAAQDPAHIFDTFLACDAVAVALSGRAGRRGPRFGPPPSGGVVTGRSGPAPTAFSG